MVEEIVGSISIGKTMFSSNMVFQQHHLRSARWLQFNYKRN